MALLSRRTWADWIGEYALAHQHPVNRACHTIGIPLVASSVVAAIASLFMPSLWPVAATAFVVGWIIQFVGHAYEGKKPEFFKDWRFLFVGLRWWIQKTQGRV
jgi:uncharacterized membrane protein YGL010W